MTFCGRVKQIKHDVIQNRTQQMKKNVEKLRSRLAHAFINNSLQNFRFLENWWTSTGCSPPCVSCGVCVLDSEFRFQSVLVSCQCGYLVNSRVCLNDFRCIFLHTHSEQDTKVPLHFRRFKWITANTFAASPSCVCIAHSGEIPFRSENAEIDAAKRNMIRRK